MDRLVTIMNVVVSNASRYERLLDAARQQYESQGYDVSARPKPAALPPSLQGYQFDLLAERQDKHILVEVKTNNKVQQVDNLDEIRKAIEELPNWQFHLFVPGQNDETDNEPI